MRQDKFTTKFHEALADAQSIGALPLLREARAIQREWGI